MADSSPAPEQDQITIHQLLERSAWSAINIQREDGSFPPGRNGVYDEKETPVRTTSHWLTTLSHVYDYTGDEQFADAAHAAADYLLSEEARPYGFTFQSRTEKWKDQCDGLVGQSAPIRGLATAGILLERDDLIKTAMNVVTLHPFDADLGLWERVEIDGSKLSFDRTLNHQILFAAAASQLVGHDDEVMKKVECFTKRLSSNMHHHDDGIIKHYIRPPTHRAIRKAVLEPNHWKLLSNEILSRLYSYSRDRKEKEIGYHPVNLLGLSQIKLNLDNFSKWSDVATAIPVGEIISREAISLIESYDGRFGASTPGIDLAVTFSHLCDGNTDRIRQWLIQDIHDKFDSKSGFMSHNTEDPVMQSSAISYAVDLPNLEIQL